MKTTNLRDINGVEIFIGATVVMPNPDANDNWTVGEFYATVKKVVDVHQIGPTVTKMLIVEDMEENQFLVSADRVEIESD